METCWVCKNVGLKELGNHVDGRISIYVRPHLMTSSTVEELVNVINNTFIHEYLHHMDKKMSHKRLYTALRALLGDDDFLPKYNVIKLDI